MKKKIVCVLGTLLAALTLTVGVAIGDVSITAGVQPWTVYTDGSLGISFGTIRFGGTGVISEETSTLTLDDGDGAPLTLQEIRNATTGSTPADTVTTLDGTGTAGAAASFSRGDHEHSVGTLNQSTSGTAANLSGTPALPNGTAATTQSQADNTTKLATTAYVDTGLGGKQATLTYPVTGVVTPTAGYLTKWGASGNAIVDGPKIGTFTDAKWCSYSTAGGMQCTENAPAGGHDAVTLGITATSILGLAAQEVGFDVQTAAYVLAGPATGDPAAPTFRALVDSDIPDTITVPTQINDTAYDATSWDGVTTAAPTKNAVRDYLETRMPSGSDGTYGAVYSNNTTRTPTAATYENYFEAGIFKVNQNGTESSIPIGPTAGQITFTGPTQARSFALPDAAATILYSGGALISTSEIAAATLVTAAEGIGSNNNDTTLPTSEAVKAYADSVAGAPTNVTPVDTADENATFYPLLVDGATGSQATETDGEFSYNPSTGVLTVPSIALGPSTAPGSTALDSDSPGADKTAGFMGWQYVDGADGAENSDWLLQIMQGGTLTTIMAFDESDDQFETSKAINSSGGFVGNVTGNASGSAATLTGTLANVASSTLANLATALSDEGTGVIAAMGNAVDGASGLATYSHTVQYAATPVIGDPDNFAANFTGANLYGGTFIANAAGTAAFPDPAAGMNFTYVLEGANANIIDPLGTGTADTITMNGLAAAADENITSSTSGAMCVFQYRAANSWMATCTGFVEATPP